MSDDKQTENLNNEQFEQLLKGISKVIIFKENETIENIINSVIGDKNIEKINSLITKCTEIHNKATLENILVTDLKNLLSKVKKFI